MFINQVGNEIREKVNIGTKSMLVLLMVFLFIIIVPLITSIYFDNGLIPSNGLTQMFYLLIFPVIGIAAIVYVIWKM
jgi:hypothetical protein